MSRAQQTPDKPAFTFLSSRGREVQTWTFADLDRQARRMAAQLSEAGAQGQAVLLVLPSGLEYVAAFFACLYADAMAVPILPPRPHRPDHRLSAVALDCGAQVALTEARLVARVQQALGPSARVLTLQDAPAEPTFAPLAAQPDTIAFLQYTSGSTADPKGVRVSHAHLLANQRMMAEAFDTSGDFSVVGWLPLHHDMGLIGNVLHPLYQGARCVLMAPETFLMRPIRWLQAIHHYRATTSGAPNFAYDLCVQRIAPEAREGLDLSSWRVAYDGAEPVRQSTLQAFSEAFSPFGFSPSAFTPCYGLAEATLLVSAAELHAPPQVDAEGRPSCGRPPTGTAVQIVDPALCAPVPEGQEGEIWVRGPGVAGGYHNRPEVSREVFEAQLAGAAPDAPTFLRTGDLGYLRDGNLYVTGRLKDLIIVAGQNYHPQDLERSAESAHAAVIPGGVAAFSFARSDEEGVVIVAELHRSAADQQAEAQAQIRESVLDGTGIALADVQLIRQGTLPRTTSGKVRRHACRDAYARGHLAPVQRTPS